MWFRLYPNPINRIAVRQIDYSPISYSLFGCAARFVFRHLVMFPLPPGEENKDCLILNFLPLDLSACLPERERSQSGNAQTGGGIQVGVLYNRFTNYDTICVTTTV